MFRLYLSHLQALKFQIDTVIEQCIVRSPTLKIIKLYNNECKRMAVLTVNICHTHTFIVIQSDYFKRWDPTMHCSLTVWIGPLRA
jgi:hypothetical protein